MIDQAKLGALTGRLLGDLGGMFSLPGTRIGFRLGLFDLLHKEGPLTVPALAERAGVSGERLLREWALAQAANGYITSDPATERFHLTPEQVMFFADRDSPLFMGGAFELAAAMMEGETKVEAALRSGGGIAWGESGACLFCAVGAFFRPGYVNNIVQSWLPAIDGAVAHLEAGAEVADIGCGVGFSTMMMASALPQSRFTGYDFHEPSILKAREHATAHGLADRVTFEVAAAKDITRDGFDLVTMFDCLHDMGDPLGCARHIRAMVAPGGAWMIVEPIAADRAEDNVASPVGRLFYNASSNICVPTSLAQEVGLALGAQAGEARLAGLLREAGFSRVRRAAEGPFNMVLEARV